MKTLREFINLIEEDGAPELPPEWQSVLQQFNKSISDKVQEFVNYFYSDVTSKGYESNLTSDQYGMGLSALVPNEMTFPLGTGGSVRRLRIKTPSGDSSAEARNTFYDKLRKEFKLSDKIYSESGSEYWRDRDVAAILIPKELGATTPEEIMSIFWRAADIVKSMGTEFVAGAGGSRNTATSMITNLDHRYYRSIIDNLKNASTNYTKGYVSRGADVLDQADHLMAIGITPEARQNLEQGKGIWREHVVPADFIQKAVLSKLQQAKTDAGQTGDESEKKTIWKSVYRECMEILTKNLLIVYVTPEQADKMDRVMKLQTTMPKDWDFTLNKPLQRLRDAGFTIVDLTSQDRKNLVQNKVGSMTAAGAEKNEKLRAKFNPYSKEKDKAASVNIDNLEESDPDYRNLLDMIDQNESLPHAPARPEPITDNPKILGRKKRPLIVAKLDTNNIDTDTNLDD